MKQGQRLNLKFSIADTDWIERLCISHLTDLEIVDLFKRQLKRDFMTAEVIGICQECGLFRSIDQRPA